MKLQLEYSNTKPGSMNSVWKPYGKPYTSKEELEAALRSFDYKKLVQELGEPLEFRVTQIEK